MTEFLSDKEKAVVFATSAVITAALFTVFMVHGPPSKLGSDPTAYHYNSTIGDSEYVVPHDIESDFKAYCLAGEGPKSMSVVYRDEYSIRYPDSADTLVDQIVIVDESGQEVCTAEFANADNGRFVVRVPPGQYTMYVASSSGTVLESVNMTSTKTEIQ